jgi:dihydrodipicolinate synthase/N-acetylneuraminate lyase
VFILGLILFVISLKNANSRGTVDAQVILVNTNVTINPASTPVFYYVDTSAARTITLPLIASVASGRIYMVKDATGNSLQNPITVEASGSDTIDGAATYTINSDEQSIQFISNGTDTWYKA